RQPLYGAIETGERVVVIADGEIALGLQQFEVVFFSHSGSASLRMTTTINAEAAETAEPTLFSACSAISAFNVVIVPPVLRPGCWRSHTSCAGFVQPGRPAARRARPASSPPPSPPRPAHPRWPCSSTRRPPRS